ncbi:hypothetical protein HYH03_016443 [Edaphochlamys debaryana]|uniref:Uncharacterized protein n=1 Tax=Edaphochlamys debaryana TaxID=47281 RepID=A0A835XPS6_9CHLO|nr:hypothetical protein HYH03_016443 [Edaphochlamys debaryana]|eukprot:KAG2484790.1 hypothetical protein HYH03_016443 [Edaphochlamys debaryana]
MLLSSRSGLLPQPPQPLLRPRLAPATPQWRASLQRAAVLLQALAATQPGSTGRAPRRGCKDRSRRGAQQGRALMF